MCHLPADRLVRKAGLSVYRDWVWVFTDVIQSFGDRHTRELFADGFVHYIRGVARPAKRKLEALNAANRLEDLNVPRSNRLVKLKGTLEGFRFDRSERSMARDFQMAQRRSARGTIS